MLKMKSKYQTENSSLSEINLTSLIDVALVLVVIFMVMTPMVMQSNILVSAPKVGKAAADEKQVEVPAEVHLAVDGTIFVNRQAVTASALITHLRTLLAANKKKLVVVSADEQAVHDHVVKILDAARQAGARELSIVKRRTPQP
jgi:biopolymer transport protein ExbD